MLLKAIKCVRRLFQDKDLINAIKNTILHIMEQFKGDGSFAADKKNGEYLVNFC
jgi:hypothetical protein